MILNNILCKLKKEYSNYKDMDGYVMAEIFLVGGCFWGLEEYIILIRGAKSSKVGYANGNKDSPTYDKKLLSLDFMLKLFYYSINPKTKNRQCSDIGPQYRTGIYYTDLNDLLVIKKYLEN